MSAARRNTLIVDFSVMPSQPDPSAAEAFIFQKLKLDISDATSIQFHNIRRCFYIEMANVEKPLQYQRQHNYKHTMQCVDNKREYKIPVYCEDGSVTVRIHDLPPSMPHATVRDHMLQYGTVLFIRSEHWKNYFGGIKNGVRVLRMHLNKPVPSYLKISGHETLCTHSGNQQKTCRFCHEPLHPDRKCGQGKQAATTPKPTTLSLSLSPIEFPELTPSIASNITPPTNDQTQQQQPQQKQKQQKPTLQQDQAKDDHDNEDEDDGFATTIAKRRLSTEKGSQSKKPCQLNSPTGVEEQNCFVLLSPMDADRGFEGKAVP